MGGLTAVSPEQYEISDFGCTVKVTSEGAEYVVFEQEGHKYRGPVSEHCLGMKMLHHIYAQDERLPSLFALRRGKVYDYREAK